MTRGAAIGIIIATVLGFGIGMQYGPFMGIALGYITWLAHTHFWTV